MYTCTCFGFLRTPKRKRNRMRWQREAQWPAPSHARPLKMSVSSWRTQPTFTFSSRRPPTACAASTCLGKKPAQREAATTVLKLLLPMTKMMLSWRQEMSVMWVETKMKHMYACTHKCMCTHSHLQTNIRACGYTHTHTHTHTHIHRLTYTHDHTHTHTHTRTHTHTCLTTKYESVYYPTDICKVTVEHKRCIAVDLCKLTYSAIHLTCVSVKWQYNTL